MDYVKRSDVYLNLLDHVLSRLSTSGTSALRQIDPTGPSALGAFGPRGLWPSGPSALGIYLA